MREHAFKLKQELKQIDQLIKYNQDEKQTSILLENRTSIIKEIEEIERKKELDYGLSKNEIKSLLDKLIRYGDLSIIVETEYGYGFESDKLYPTADLKLFDEIIYSETK